MLLYLVNNPFYYYSKFLNVYMYKYNNTYSTVSKLGNNVVIFYISQRLTNFYDTRVQGLLIKKLLQHFVLHVRKINKFRIIHHSLCHLTDDQ